MEAHAKFILMVSTRTLFVGWLTLALFGTFVQAEEFSKEQLEVFSLLTQEVRSLGEKNWRFTAIAPLKPEVVPLFWGNHKAYTGDSRWPQHSYPPVAIASEYQKGRFIALGHDGLLIDPSANDDFTGNILSWLGDGYKHKKVIIYTHISNWFNQGIMTAKAKELLAARGVEIYELGSPVSDDDLNQCDLLILVRPSQLIEQTEIDSIVSYIEQGGGLLMSGTGYLWAAQHKSHDMKDFPLNRLGERLGFEYSKTSIDKTPPNNNEGARRYSLVPFYPLSARKPIEVKNYSIKEHSNRSIADDIALNKDHFHYVVEGDHVIVSMPYGFWVECGRPVDFIQQLDTVYDLYADLTAGTKPFHGNKIAILNVDNLKFHMCSGNPILSRQDRMEYILSELEKSNYKNPSWGLMHELGHDFIIAMKHRFVFGDGDNESWAEFFALYGCQQMGLEPDKKPTWLAVTEAYRKAGGHDFKRIKSEKWFMIGFLHHIQEQYGWEVYKKLFDRYAELVRKNDYPNFNAIKNDAAETRKKVNVFVKELSLAAGVNFYPYFARWGFPTDRSVDHELKHLPNATLFE
jgi:hypothetical protein